MKIVEWKNIPSTKFPLSFKYFLRWVTKPIKPFKLTYNDVRDKLNSDRVNGQIIVEFVIDESGDVIEPNIIDTFNLTLNDVILDKVRQMEFSPPIMNGHPVKVRYKLPILFR